MLIILCIFFPPALIFVIPYYLLGNRNASRASAKAQWQTNKTLADLHKESQIIAFAAMTDEQQSRVTTALQQEKIKQQNRSTINSAIWIGVILAVIALVIALQP
jgi:L-rhamnose isomerase